MPPIRVIGLDADDTLWHNETIFAGVHERYRALLAKYHDTTTVDRTLLATELRNLDLYGYGIKSFMLSAVETAIDLTRGEISAAEIRSILELGRGMLAHAVELLDGAADTVAALAKTHTLILITKGDLRDQQRKLSKSGLAPHFAHIEIVAEKNAAIYDGILRRHGIAPAEFLMVGNSMKSDILPVLALGGFAAHVPYHLLWAEDHTPETPAAPGRFFELRTLRELTSLLAASS